MREGRACRGRTHAGPRSEVKSRGVMREGRACRGRTHAGPRSEAKSRGVMREGRACRGRTRAGPVPKRSRAASCGRAALVAAAPAPGPFRSEVARRHAGGPRLSRPYPRRARSEVKSRGVMREGRACRGRTRAGPVRTPYGEPPPPLCLRFQCVIKSRPLPEPPSPKASSPR